MLDSSVVLDQVGRSLAIARKDLRVYYAKGPVVIFGIVISLVPILVGLIGGANIQYPFILGTGIILSALCFSSMALIFSFPATSLPSTIMMLYSLVKFPLVFVSGVFVPVAGLPAWGKVVASLSPLTYFTEIARYCIGGKTYYPLSVGFLLLLMFTILFWTAAVTVHKRTLPRRV